jgi:AcrR family transcriptional regulator
MTRRRRTRRTRPYRSALRDHLKAEARERIVKATVDVIVRRGIEAFTMQTVADEAGVALRTVYRYFPTRVQLLEGLFNHVDATVYATGLQPPTSVADVDGVMVRMYDAFGRVRNEMRAGVVASIATGYRSVSHRARYADVRRMLADAFPALAATEIDDAAAVLFAVSGSRVWYVLTAELGLDAARGGKAADWAVRLLLDDLRRRNSTAAKRAGARGRTP